MSQNFVVNQDRAAALLSEALNVAKQRDAFSSSGESLIKSILEGSHLTFKYILFTAILAKATDHRINPLCLQVSSKLEGSYDARSLCHSVIVPFEKHSLSKILGGSNEPYLNKPARFPEIDPNNAVRAGADRVKLLALYSELPNLTDSKIALEWLIDFLYETLLLIKERDADVAKRLSSTDTTRAVLYQFFSEFLNQNNEGESLTLVVANLYNLLYEEDNTIRVDVHPVNQSGASRKEISDLDIIKDETLFIANELKDKSFSAVDVEHAADKVIQALGNQMLFIVGRNGFCSEDELDKTISDYINAGFYVRVLSIDTFIDMMLSLCSKPDINTVIRYTAAVIRDKKFKKTTEKYFYHVLDNLSLDT